jgi:hypothetical protein
VCQPTSVIIEAGLPDHFPELVIHNNIVFTSI